MKRISYLVLMSLTVALSGLNGQEDVSYPSLWTKGYVKYLSSFFQTNFQGVSDKISGQLIHHRLDTEIQFASNINLAIGWRNQFYFGELVRRSPGFSDRLKDQQSGFINLSWNPLDEESYFLNTSFDRLYLEWYSGGWEISLGRQRINWGISTTWNAHDIFNAYSFVDFDYEERPGNDALLIKNYYGETSSLELAIGLTGQKEDMIIGALWKFNRAQYDFQFLAGYFEQNLVLGSGWAGNLGNAGFKGEFSWFGATREENENAFIFSTGVDYTVDKWYINAGYLFNSLGESNSSIVELFVFSISAKNVYPYKHAILLQNSIQFNPLFTGGITFVYTPSSTHPLFVGPLLSYSLSENLDLNFISQVGMQKEDGFNSPFQSYYLRLKWSF